MKKLMWIWVILFAAGFAFFPPQQTGSLTKQVAASADDVNEDGTGFDMTNTAMWIGTGQSTTNSYAGFRFTGVAIPTGATITAARVEFYSTQFQWIAIGVSLAAEAADNAAAYSASAKPSQRALTTQQVSQHDDVPWQANTWYPYNIQSVVQEVVSRPGWKSGNALNVIVKGVSGAWARKNVASFDKSSAQAARLIVSYSTGGTPLTPTATRTATPVVPTATRTATPVVPTATRTATPAQPSATPTRTATPGGIVPTPTQVLVPSIMLNSVPPQPLPVGLLTIRVRNAAGAYLNGVGVKFQSCVTPGANTCTAYEGDTTQVTFNRFDSDGIIHLVVNCDMWYRLTLGTMVRDVYFAPSTGYQYVEFTQ